MTAHARHFTLVVLVVISTATPLCAVQHCLAADFGTPIRLGKGAVGHGDRAVEFSPDGQTLAVATSIGVSLYDAKTTREIGRLTGNNGGGVNNVAFSPDGAILASGGSGDVTLRLWDGNTGQPITALHGHGDAIRKIVFAADGGRLASCSVDGTVLLWSVPALLESTE